MEKKEFGLKPKSMDLKVYTNKRTGQRMVVLPKKRIPNVKKVKIQW